MKVNLHANATTTPKVRAYIQQSQASVAELAAELGISQTTVRRWKGRVTTQDGAHRPHRLQTAFDATEEAIAVELRTRLRLSLDDCLEVMRRCVRPDISRSALHRALRRHGVSRLPAPRPVSDVQPFEATRFGFVHVDLKHLTRLEGRPAFVFAAIERTTRFAHIEIIHDRSAATVAACFERFLEAFGHPVHTVVTDNGSEFTDRFGSARWHRRDRGTGRAAFDRVCARRGIEHRLTRPYRPQTNGLVERFNRRLSEALRSAPANGKNAGRNRFHSHQDRNVFLHNVVHAYNRTRLRCLGYNAPLEVLNNQPGQNTQAGIAQRFQPDPRRRGEGPRGSNEPPRMRL